MFTRAQLALFGQVPWRAVPVMPLEIMHLPLWFPFHLSKVSYWSRTVIVPLLVLMALRPRGAQSARCRASRSCSARRPSRCATGSAARIAPRWGPFFKGVDVRAARGAAVFPRRSRQRAIDKAVRFVTERLNGDDGLGGIYPAIANSVMMFDTLGYPPDHPGCGDRLARGAQAAGGRGRIAPTASPACRRSGTPASPATPMAEAGRRHRTPPARWLRERQILDVVGDWAVRRPGLRPGGWAFQYANPHYPDVDDTAVVGMLLHRNGDPAHAEAIARAREWIIGMQSSRRRLGRVRAGEHASTISTTSRSPIMARCSIRRPPT